MRQSFQIATVLIAIVLIARFDLFLSSFLVFGLRDFHHLDHSFAKPPCYFTTQKTRVIHRQVSKSQMQINSYPFIRLSTPTTIHTPLQIPFYPHQFPVPARAQEPGWPVSRASTPPHRQVLLHVALYRYACTVLYRTGHLEF